ncbi:hypothetical protein Purlil1_11250 [Purpureocillium lilacinum]|nr:hypothetical protein Purlil1_11250 [Purpureocillium lilacinum]
MQASIHSTAGASTAAGTHLTIPSSPAGALPSTILHRSFPFFTFFSPLSHQLHRQPQSAHPPPPSRARVLNSSPFSTSPFFHTPLAFPATATPAAISPVDADSYRLDLVQGSRTTAPLLAFRAATCHRPIVVHADPCPSPASSRASQPPSPYAIPLRPDARAEP